MKKYKNNPPTDIQNLKQFGEFGGVNPSITDSSTFTFMSADTMSDTFQGKVDGCFLYSRHWNPSNKYLSQALAVMEGTEDAWVTASGMSAITTVFLQLCNAGDHIVSSLTTYGGTYAFLKNYLVKFNIEVSFVDITDLESVEKAIKPNTKLIYTESLTNPLLQVSDIPKLSEIAKSNNLKLVVDNTFTPMILSPYKLGADIVVYSLTKFINGKNDAIAGAICANHQFINDISDVIDGTAMLLGPVLDPLRSSSILKNLHTLHVRMIQHSKNALYLANKLENDGIDLVYPGLKKHSQHSLFNQMYNEDFGYGGIILLDVKTVENAKNLMENMQKLGVGYHAVSLGYFKTLFSNSGKSTSSEIPEEIQMSMNLSAGQIRLSVGLDYDIERTYQLIHQSLVNSNLLSKTNTLEKINFS